MIDNARAEHGRPFCDMAPGRIRCDVGGNLWAASCFGGPASTGVQVFAPDGAKIGMIHLPELCSNLCFGGLKRNRLFMTGGQSLYALYLDTQIDPRLRRRGRRPPAPRVGWSIRQGRCDR